MKRIDFIRHLESYGCEFMREGGSHMIFVNRRVQRSTSVPRHREINDFLAKKICRDLQVPDPDRRSNL